MPLLSSTIFPGRNDTWWSLQEQLLDNAAGMPLQFVPSLLSAGCLHVEEKSRRKGADDTEQVHFCSTEESIAVSKQPYALCLQLSLMSPLVKVCCHCTVVSGHRDAASHMKSDKGWAFSQTVRLTASACHCNVTDISSRILRSSCPPLA